jgi:multiple sugar transport system permease protein
MATVEETRTAPPRPTGGYGKPPSAAKTRLKSIARFAAILLFAALFAFPLYWAVTMSMKPQPEWNPPVGKVYWTPENPTLDNFRDILGVAEEEEGFFARVRTKDAIQPLKNSIVTATLGTVLAMVVGVLAAYGIARFRAGGGILPFQILQLRMFPPIAIIIPLLFMFVEINIWNTWLGLILLYGAVTFPFAVWLMRSFFAELPKEISEAAIVDGCTQWGAFFKAVLPMAKGGLAATALFVFILNWSDFLIAKVMTQDDGATAPVYLQTLQGGATGVEYGLQAALAVLLIIPPAIFGLAIQRYLVRGLTFGAIKQ